MTLDDDLRSALARREPGGDDFADVRRRAHALRRRRRLVSGAVVLASVAGLGAVALGIAGEDRAGVVTDQPSTSTTADVTVTPATPTTGAPATASTAGTPAAGPRPGIVVALDDHRRLVVVDAVTGQIVRRLDAEGDPTEPPVSTHEPGPNVLDAPVLGPDGTVWYTSIGEPASGSVLRIGIDGTPFEDGPHPPGSYVSVSPDGQRIAASYFVGARVTPAGDPGATGIDLGLGGGDDVDAAYVGDLAWSPDGRLIAAERQAQSEGVFWSYRVDVAAADGTGSPTLLAPATPGRHWSGPAFRSDGRLVVAEQRPCLPGLTTDDPACAGGNEGARIVDPATGEVVGSFDYGTDAFVVDQNYDASGTWLLVTFSDGTLRWYGAGGSGTVPGSYVAADW